MLRHGFLHLRADRSLLLLIQFQSPGQSRDHERHHFLPPVSVSVLANGTFIEIGDIHLADDGLPRFHELGDGGAKRVAAFLD